jgi:hypothetical protein
VRAELALVAISFVAALAGCAESQLEPRSDWIASPVIFAPSPGAAEIHTIVAPEKWVENPAPSAPVRRPSISLGFIGDEPLGESEQGRPRWPWIPEPFRMDTWGWRHGDVPPAFAPQPQDY